MTRAEIIDIIKGLVGIRVDSLFTYKESYTEADMTPNAIPNWQTFQDYIGSTDPIIQAIPTNSAGLYAFSYDGSMGDNPLFYVQQIVSGDSVNRFDITCKINSAGTTITALADFSMDTYQLVIRK